MTPVIQIYKSVHRFEKPNYTTETRKKLNQWPDSIISRIGYLEDGRLVLPAGIEIPDLNQTGLILLQDIISPNPYQTHAANQPLIGLSRPWRQCSFELLNLKSNGEASFDLYLDYTHNRMQIGIPERADHKIAELTAQKPVRYQVNGKSDGTLTRGRQRTYMEFDYVLQYLGQADRIEVMDLSKIEKRKSIPIESCHRVDERKILY